MGAGSESEDWLVVVAWLEYEVGSVLGACGASDLIERRNHSVDDTASGSSIEATKPEEVFLTMFEEAFKRNKSQKYDGDLLGAGRM